MHLCRDTEGVFPYYFQIAPEYPGIDTVDPALKLVAFLTVCVSVGIEPAPADEATDTLRITESCLFQRFAEFAGQNQYFIAGDGSKTLGHVIIKIVTVGSDPVYNKVPRALNGIFQRYCPDVRRDRHGPDSDNVPLVHHGCWNTDREDSHPD